MSASVQRNRRKRELLSAGLDVSEKEDFDVRVEIKVFPTANRSLRNHATFGFWLQIFLLSVCS